MLEFIFISNSRSITINFTYSPCFGPENYSFVFSFEKTFDSVKSTAWMQEHWHYSVIVSFVYMISIYFGQKFMKSRKPFELNILLFIWNFILAALSLMGLLRMTPELFWSVNSNSFIYSICTASFFQGVSGYWTEMFAMLKVVELGDTVVSFLRKRSVHFFHWYRHIIVLVYAWHAYKDHTASGRWFIWMDYAVHVVMYLYYTIRTLKIHVPKSCRIILTFFQFAPMFVGLFIVITVNALKSIDHSCQQTWSNIYFLFLIQLFNFLFFCNFIYHGCLPRNDSNVLKKKLNEDDTCEDSLVVEDKTETFPNIEHDVIGRILKGICRTKLLLFERIEYWWQCFSNFIDEEDELTKVTHLLQTHVEGLKARRDTLDRFRLRFKEYEIDKIYSKNIREIIDEIMARGIILAKFVNELDKIYGFGESFCAAELVERCFSKTEEMKKFSGDFAKNEESYGFLVENQASAYLCTDKHTKIYKIWEEICRVIQVLFKKFGNWWQHFLNSVDDEDRLIKMKRFLHLESKRSVAQRVAIGIFRERWNNIVISKRSSTETASETIERYFGKLEAYGKFLVVLSKIDGNDESFSAAEFVERCFDEIDKLPDDLVKDEETSGSHLRQRQWK